jgi:hypothetical protein
MASEQARHEATSGVPGLEFKLSQISKNPPSLLVALKNSHPKTTYTVLKWGTPLDPQAANLGIFKIQDADTGEEVKTDIIKIGRKFPPPRDDLQEIEPGTEQATEIVLDKPWMPQKKPAKYKIYVEGEFHGVWEKPASEVQTKEVEDYTDTAFEGSRFRSEQVNVLVE